MTVASSSFEGLDRCNCTWCTKLANQGLRVTPFNFKLPSPSSPKELGDYYNDYPRTPNKMHRCFCSYCRTHLQMQGAYEFNGIIEVFQVNMRSIDQPRDAIDLSTVRSTYINGLKNNKAAGPKEKPWPGGLPSVDQHDSVIGSIKEQKVDLPSRRGMFRSIPTGKTCPFLQIAGHNVLCPSIIRYRREQAWVTYLLRNSKFFPDKFIANRWRNRISAANQGMQRHLRETWKE